MAVLDLLKYPDPLLKTISKPVVDFGAELQHFLADLEETMLAGPGGVGIAAPQVACFQRIAIVDVSSKPKVEQHGRLVLINPEIIEWQGFVKGREGCMSVPDYTGNVMRAERITLEFLDATGQKQQIETGGFEARAIQHELDHLDGLLFLDRLVSRRNDLFKRKTFAPKPAATSS